jgi:hypothetical protein
VRLDAAIALFATATAALVSFIAVVSPSNIYAYIASPIVVYFVTLSHHPEAKYARGKAFIDALLVLILLGLVAYRAYMFITTSH